MQVAGSVYPASQPINPYHTLYHPPFPTPQDHELKRQYLGLLPPQQIIEICLTFDLHVSPYIKSTVWPLDFSAAIASLRKSSAEAKEDSVKTSEDATQMNGEAIMDSLADSQSEASPAPEEPTEKPADEPRPPDKDVEERSSAGTSTTTRTPTPAPATPAPVPPPPHTPASVVQPPPMAHGYSHQPYNYPYPHAPYYPPPPAYPYSHHHYPPYPQYPQPPQAPGYPPPQQSMYPPPPLAHMPPPMQDGNAGDDLPSYEEMIVEALADSNDPEGCAPKDLFTWMAARYPLQSNFRPSASQALQKAYKRGRLEKSTNNKYRLNAAWEGGSTSRRTTRRPQTHPHQSSSSNQITSSPFTNAPLVHHPQNHQQNQNQQAQAQPYPYGYLYAQTTHPPTHPPPTQPQAPPSIPQPSRAAEPKTTNPPEGASSDAYEAAQSILKAINFGSLLSLPAEETQEGISGKDAAQTLQQQPLLQGHPPALLPPPPANASLMGVIEVGQAMTTVEAGARAELQAHLVLLAAQLSELAKMEDPVAQVQEQPQQRLPLPPPPQSFAILPTPPTEGFVASNLPQPQLPVEVAVPISAPATNPAPVSALESVPAEEDKDDRDALEPPEGETESDDDDMEVVI